MRFLQGLSSLDWTAIHLENTQKITNLSLQILNTISWQDSFVVQNTTKAIVDIFLDKEGRLKVVPQEIQEAFFNKTQSLLFESPITTDMFLGLNQILPRFQAKDMLKRLKILGGEGKIEEFPESLGSLTSLALSKVKVGTAELAKLPSLNNLYFEDVTLDRLVIDPAHSKLKITKYSLSVTEIQGLENLEVFQKETLSSKDPFFNEITGLEAIKFTNPNHKIETLIFKGNKLSRIEGLNNLPNLHVLDLSGTKLASLELFPHLKETQIHLGGTSVENLMGLEIYAKSESGRATLDISNILQPMEHIGKIVFTRPDRDLVTLRINAERELARGLLTIGSIEGLENFENLQSIEIGGVSLHSLNFDQDLEKLESIIMNNGQLDELKGLDHLPALEVLKVPSVAPEKIELPEGVNFAQEFMRGVPAPKEPKIITFKRPSVGKPHEEND